MEIAFVEADAVIEPRANNANVDTKPNANHAIDFNISIHSLYRSSYLNNSTQYSPKQIINSYYKIKLSPTMIEIGSSRL
jgi:hypothetical protein